MKLYGFPPTRSIRVLWTLRELNVEFEYVTVDATKGELRRPEFLAVNPAGKGRLHTQACGETRANSWRR
jgi:glutathione S-transferase